MQELLHLIRYDYETGLFHELGTNKVLGSPDDKGYIILHINYKKYKAHQVAFMFMGQPIPEKVDHKDNDPSNNKWENLRPANAFQNACNRPSTNATGYKGVRFQNGRYHAQLRKEGKAYYGGSHSTAEEAARAYDNLAKLHFGEYAYLNFGEEYANN